MRPRITIEFTGRSRVSRRRTAIETGIALVMIAAGVALTLVIAGAR